MAAKPFIYVFGGMNPYFPFGMKISAKVTGAQYIESFLVLCRLYNYYNRASPPC